MGARVVPGSIGVTPVAARCAFRVSDGDQSYPVVYRGVIPDTFTDSADVVVDGRLGPDGTFRATTLLAKCASRYENAPDKYRSTRLATDRRRRRFAPEIAARAPTRGVDGRHDSGRRAVAVGRPAIRGVGLLSCRSRGAMFRRPDLTDTAERALYATWGFVVLASLGLWTALVRHDFTLRTSRRTRARICPRSTR